MIKKSKWFIFLIFSFSLLLAGEGGRINIAITDFGDQTKAGKKYLPVVNQAISEYLSQTKQFNIVDRKNLGKVLKEKDLILSGLTTADETKEIAKILNTQYLVLGDIVDISIAEGNQVRKEELVKKSLITYDKEGKEKKIWYYEKVVNVYTPYSFSVKISGKLIDSETSEVSTIKTGQATDSKKAPKRLTQSEKSSIIKNLLQKSAKDLIASLVRDIKLTGKIIDVQKNNKKVIISLGKNNDLSVKDNLAVYKRKKITMGEKTYFLKEKVATLIVTKVGEELSEAKIFSDEDFYQLQVGQTLKIVETKSEIIDPKPEAIEVVKNPFPTIASAFIPGAGQFINGQPVVATWTFIFEALFFWVGISAILGNFDEPLYNALTPRLDNVIEKNGKMYDINGNETTTEGKLKNLILSSNPASIGWTIIGWTFTVMGAFLHIANIGVAYEGTPPSSYAFSYQGKNFSLEPYLYTFNHQEAHYQLGLSLNF